MLLQFLLLNIYACSFLLQIGRSVFLLKARSCPRYLTENTWKWNIVAGKNGVQEDSALGWHRQGSF